jgi:hypothetical protein
MYYIFSYITDLIGKESINLLFLKLKDLIYYTPKL